MGEITANALIRGLAKRPEKVYFIYGKSVPDVERCVKAVVKRAVSPDDELFNLHTFDGRNFDAKAFAAACDTLPVFGEYVCVTIHDMNAERLLAGDMKIMTETISHLSESNVVVIYYTGFDITDGKKYPTPKHKKLSDLISKYGSVCVCNPKTPAALGKDIESYVKTLGGHISADAAAYLATVVSTDSQIAKRECEKLVAYEAEVTLENINLLTPKQLDANIYDLSRAVSAFDLKNTMRIFDELIAMRVEPITILYTLSGNILDLYRAKIADMAMKTPQNVKDDFGYPHNIGFRVDNAFRDARRIELSHLRKCVCIMAETDLQMKTTSMDGVILLQTALVRMITRLEK